MRTFLLAIAVMLILASLGAFLWTGSTSTEAGRPERFVVSGRVGGDISDHPWAGTLAQLGVEQHVLNDDGTFSFAVLPGRYSLKVCCSPAFQAIDEEFLVDSDMRLELSVKPLLEVKGRASFRGNEPAEGLRVSAHLSDTNVLDRVVSAADGSFLFHLTEGEWQVEVEGAPVQSMTFNGVPLQGDLLRLEGKRGDAFALQITLR